MGGNHVGLPGRQNRGFSLSRVFPRPTHSTACINILLLYIAEQYSSNLLIYLLTDKDLVVSGLGLL